MAPYVALFGQPAYLTECTIPKLKTILRLTGVVSPQDLLEPYDKSQLIQLCEEGGLGPEVPDDWSLELNKQRMQAEEAVQRDTHSPRTRGRIRSARRTGRLGGYAYSQSSSPPRQHLHRVAKARLGLIVQACC